MNNINEIISDSEREDLIRRYAQEISRNGQENASVFSKRIANIKKWWIEHKYSRLVAWVILSAWAVAAAASWALALAWWLLVWRAVMWAVWWYIAADSTFDIINSKLSKNPFELLVWKSKYDSIEEIDIEMAKEKTRWLKRHEFIWLMEKWEKDNKRKWTIKKVISTWVAVALWALWWSRVLEIATTPGVWEIQEHVRSKAMNLLNEHTIGKTSMPWVKEIFADIKADHPNQSYVTLEQAARRIEGLKQWIPLSESYRLNDLNSEIAESIRKPWSKIIEAAHKLWYLSWNQSLDSIAPKLSEKAIWDIIGTVYKDDLAWGFMSQWLSHNYDLIPSHVPNSIYTPISWSTSSVSWKIWAWLVWAAIGWAWSALLFKNNDRNSTDEQPMQDNAAGRRSTQETITSQNPGIQTRDNESSISTIRPLNPTETWTLITSVSREIKDTISQPIELLVSVNKENDKPSIPEELWDDEESEEINAIQGNDTISEPLIVNPLQNQSSNITADNSSEVLENSRDRFVIVTQYLQKILWFNFVQAWESGWITTSFYSKKTLWWDFAATYHERDWKWILKLYWYDHGTKKLEFNADINIENHADITNTARFKDEFESSALAKIKEMMVRRDIMKSKEFADTLHTVEISTSDLKLIYAQVEEPYIVRNSLETWWFWHQSCYDLHNWVMRYTNLKNPTLEQMNVSAANFSFIPDEWDKYFTEHYYKWLPLIHGQKEWEMIKILAREWMTETWNLMPWWMNYYNWHKHPKSLPTPSGMDLFNPQAWPERFKTDPSMMALTWFIAVEIYDSEIPRVIPENVIILRWRDYSWSRNYMLSLFLQRRDLKHSSELRKLKAVVVDE